MRATMINRGHVNFEVGGVGKVSATLSAPDSAFACLVLAHGAGAGMNHPFMQAVAEGLGARGMATLRFNFPYMERGSKRPDTPSVAHAAVRAAVTTVGKLIPDLPLLAGGKSFGGRMTSQTQAEDPLPNVAGLVFLGFPLHPAGKPSDDRSRHLSDISIPMLFLQGTRDALADRHLLTAVVEQLPSATLRWFEDADHSFHVLARTGRTDREVLDGLLDTMATWARSLLSDRRSDVGSTRRSRR